MKSYEPCVCGDPECGRCFPKPCSREDVEPADIPDWWEADIEIGRKWCAAVDAACQDADTPPPAPFDGLDALIRHEGGLEELPALALLDEIRGLRKTCPDCTAHDLIRAPARETFVYGEGDSAVTLEADVTVETCRGCGFQTTGRDGELARAAVLQRHLARVATARAEAAEKRVAEWERRFKVASEESLAALREALDTARHITDLHATAIKERNALKDERHQILVAIMDCAEIGAHLRFDAWRAEGTPPWTAWIPGKGRGDGQTPVEAVTSLKADLKARKEKPRG